MGKIFIVDNRIELALAAATYVDYKTRPLLSAHAAWQKGFYCAHFLLFLHPKKNELAFHMSHRTLFCDCIPGKIVTGICFKMDHRHAKGISCQSIIIFLRDALTKIDDNY